jgi:hypothetical protein
MTEATSTLTRAGLKRLAHREAGAGKADAELPRLAPRDLVVQQHRQEVGVGKLPVNGFAVALLERIKNA